MPVERERANGFDKLARSYRWMEYLSLGPLLWRTRTAFLAKMVHARRALVLGDGDGRFAAALLRVNRGVRICALDASCRMLEALRKRTEAQDDAARVETICADARVSIPTGSYDLICTHFFLDCLSEDEVYSVANHCAARLAGGGTWIVSEFAIPQGGMATPARVLVWLLYVAFGALTGLRVRSLPDYAAALQEAGLICTEVRLRLCGILRSERWERSG